MSVESATCAPLSAPNPDARHLRELTRLVFEIGFNPALVAARWSAFDDAFHGFEPQRVAELGPADLERLVLDTRLIRNRQKLAATIENARAMVRLAATHDSFDALLGRLADEPYERRATLLVGVFSYVGPRVAFAFLQGLGLGDGHDLSGEAA